MMKKIFTEHPHSIGESYSQHFKAAFSFGFNMLLGGMACVIHAFFPNFFEKTGSNILLKMTQQFIKRMPSLDKRVEGIALAIEEKATHQ